MSEENKVEVLEEKVELLTQKLNEVVSCLQDNKLSRKVPVDYIYSEGEEEEEITTKEETTTEEEETTTEED